MDSSFEIVEEGMISELTKGSPILAANDNPGQPGGSFLPMEG
jgi:hypothetical protein